MKKYKFTGETKTVELKSETVTLHRIKAVAEFGSVGIGDFGGWIEKEKNLSHEGMAWVSGNAVVRGDAVVDDSARVCGNAVICGNAEVRGVAVVSDNAVICGNAVVRGFAEVSDNAVI